MTTSDDLDKLNWQKLVAPYARPDLRRSLWQVANSVLPFLALWAAMLWSLNLTYWLTLALTILTAGFMIRTFILFHDCCHGSFFQSRRANETLGAILGVLTLTPYQHWKHHHAIHHATAGNLDKRGVGDVKTMTLSEYLAAPRWKRIGYRIMRHPFWMLVFGAPLVFLVVHRFWASGSGRRERLSVIYTDLALLALFLILGGLFGFIEVILVQLPITMLGTAVGVWMFYVQHQFEGVYWERKDRWSFVRAGLQGSSYYRLPTVLQWFTGNIGFHHIHHLSSRIPNYFLEPCYKANPVFQIRPLTFLESLKSATLHLWDEAEGKLVGFEAARRTRLGGTAPAGRG
jgi:omega-6 fatty acid desaturase (delta-12 desaturase)